MALAEELGASIAARGWVLLSGGRPVGVMAAACRGAAQVEGHLVIGVLPDAGREREATAEVDVALFTGMGQARNVINVLSADVVVVCGAGIAGQGCAGTASEAAHAIKAGRPLVLLGAAPLWQQFFASLGGVVACAAEVESCCKAIEVLLKTREADRSHRKRNN